MEQLKKKRGRPRKYKDPYLTKKERAKIRKADFIRCQNYLTAEDFEKMYGEKNDK